MSYIIQCQCGQKMTVEDDHAGRQAVCVGCGKTISVPENPGQPGAVAMASPIGGQPGDQASPVLSASASPPAAPPEYGGGGAYGQQPGWYKPHRGNLILGLGIGALAVALFCCCCNILAIALAIPAIIFGIDDLGEIKAGKMDPAGQSLTTVGLVCAVIAILIALGLTGFSFAMHGPDIFHNRIPQFPST